MWWKLRYCYYATRLWGWMPRLYWEWATSWYDGKKDGTWDADTTPSEAVYEDASNA